MPGPRYVKDFEFPSSFGFTGSATDLPRAGFAEGGRVMRQTGGSARYSQEELDAIRKMPPEKRSPAEQRAIEAATPPPNKSREFMRRYKNRSAEELRELGLKSGGRVKKAVGGSLTKRSKPTSVLDQESGGKSPLRPGFDRGGRTKKALGGAVKYAEGGMKKSDC